MTLFQTLHLFPRIATTGTVKITGLIAVALVITVLTACSSKEKKAGQALAKVNGEEITVMQVNDELRRAGVTADAQQAASKQALESLIDRQLLMSEAMRSEVDRTVDVVQAIERAKAQIIVQAYLKSLSSKVAAPSTIDISDYFLQHPEYFTQRKIFDVQQLVIATRDFTPDLRAVMEGAKSLDGVAGWLEQHNVRYVRGQLARSSTDLPEHMVAKLKDMQKGQLFIVNEGENSMINQISNVRLAPISEEVAAPQIRQFLLSKKTKDAADAEIAHLRASARIEYLGTATLVAK